MAEGVLVKVIDKQLDLVYQTEMIDDSDPQYIWYIKNSDNNLYDLFTIRKLKKYIKWIADYFGIHRRDLTKLAIKVMDELCTGAAAKDEGEDDDLEAEKFTPHPSNYILAYNGIFDNKTKQFYLLGSKK